MSTVREPLSAEEIARETEANEFAANLLVPLPWLRSEVDKLGGIDIADDEAIKTLAHIFDVPITLIAYQLAAGKKEPRRWRIP